MKVVLVSTYERKGGAAIACYRLKEALLKESVDVTLLTAYKTSDDPTVVTPFDTRWKRLKNRFHFYKERFSIFIKNGFSRKNLFAISIADSGTDISAHPIIREADIIHLHWINQGFLSLNGIKELCKLGKPIVVTMHDMWFCTGICHHARECISYQNICRECMFLQNPGIYDLSYQTYLEKRFIHSSDITFVTCSRWLQEKVISSMLIQESLVKTIPNPIDIDFFSEGDRSFSRKLMKLPENKKLILFGAVNAGDKRKGVDFFVKALDILSQKYPDLKESVTVVIFGNFKGSSFPKLSFPHIALGYLAKEDDILNLYRAVDVYVIPSLEENLPNTIMESMSCGTPCVGFDVGGIPEIIDHGDNGYVAKYKDPMDMAEGIYKTLFCGDYNQLRLNARKKIENCYSEKLVAERYIRLYESKI